MKKPLTLCLAMIVRNEEKVLPRCLKSVLGVVDEMVIVDTGSTDRTKEVVAGTAAGADSKRKLPLGLKLLDFEWSDDFSAARNAGLEQVDADWILQLDADEELARRDRHELPRILSDPDKLGYFIKLYNAADESSIASAGSYAPALRLFRNHAGVRFQNIIHEQVKIEDRGRLGLSGLAIVHFGPSIDDDQAISERRGRNMLLLKKAVARSSGSGRDHAYFLGKLGEEYMFAGQLETAVKTFERSLACEAGGGEAGDDAVFLAQIERNLARCIYDLGLTSEAEHRLQLFIEARPDYTDLVFLSGKIALDRGERRRAAELFRRCLQMGDPPGYYGTYGGTGTWRAEQMLQRALGRRISEGKRAR